MTNSPGRNARTPPADEFPEPQRAHAPGESQQPGQRSGCGSRTVLKYMLQDSQAKLAPHRAH